MKQQFNKAIVWIPDMYTYKLQKGFVLPDGYRVSTSSAQAFRNEHRLSTGFIVEGEDIPYSTPGRELPNLYAEYDEYDHIVVKRWQE